MCRPKKSPRKKMANLPNIDELIRQMTTNSIKLKSLKRKFDGFKGEWNLITSLLNYRTINSYSKLICVQLNVNAMLILYFHRPNENRPARAEWISTWIEGHVKRGQERKCGKHGNWPFIVGNHSKWKSRQRTSISPIAPCYWITTKRFIVQQNQSHSSFFPWESPWAIKHNHKMTM